MNSPPGIRLFKTCVLFLTNHFAIELARATRGAHFLVLRIPQLLFRIFLLLILLLHTNAPVDSFFPISLSDSGPNICSTRCLSLPSLEALAMMARLQQVVPFLAEAMATSADSFIAFFLSKMLMFFFEELHLWRPVIHFLRNSCLSELGGRILQKQKKLSVSMWYQTINIFVIYTEFIIYKAFK